MAIYHTLNLFNFDVTQRALIAEGWCPVANMEDIVGALRRGQVGEFKILCMVYVFACAFSLRAACACMSILCLRNQNSSLDLCNCR